MSEKFCELCGLDMDLGLPTDAGRAHLLCAEGVAAYEFHELDKKVFIRTIHSLENSNVLLKIENNRLSKALRRLKDEGYRLKPDTGEE